MGMYHPKDQWIQTMRGKQFFPANPDPDLIDPFEIAVVLSATPRFSRHTKFFYSVAAHSVWALRHVESSLQIFHGFYSDEEALALRRAALTHDAHEVYSGFGDVASPMKSICPQIKEIERGIDRAVAQRFGFQPIFFENALVKTADLVALATEKRDLMESEPAPWIKLPDPAPETIQVRTTDDDCDAFLIALDEVGIGI